MLSGSLVALITPMTERGDIDFDALSLLIEHHVASGSHGLVVAGTTGESATLDMAEHLELVARTSYNFV